MELDQGVTPEAPPTEGAPPEARTLAQEIAIAVRAAIDPLAKQWEEARLQQADFAKKANKQFATARMKADGKDLAPDDDDASSRMSGMEMLEEKLSLMAELPSDLRTTVRDELRGVPLEMQIKMIKLFLAKRDVTSNPPATNSAPKPVATARGGAPQGTPSASVAYPRSQVEFVKMSKEARDRIMKDPAFDPTVLPPAVRD